jgi:hypothetical protein
MLQRAVIIFVVLFLCLDSESFGQDENGIRKKNSSCGYSLFETHTNFKSLLRTPIKRPLRYNETFIRKDESQSQKERSFSSLKVTGNSPRFSLLTSPLQPDYYSKGMGFMCQKELQLEKMTAIPVRLRLGSVDYVNYLEQKPNAIKPN